MPSPFAPLWDLDPAVTFLNHGSFGACPRAVLAEQVRLRARMEAEPVRFFVRELPDLLDRARAALAAFVGAPAEGLAFVANATTGVNTALRSLRLEPGDEVLTTDHAYRACRNALDEVAASAGARVVVAAVPFPLDSAAAAAAAVLARAGRRTRAALLDHVASPTGLVLPIGPMVAELEGAGVRVVVDGAHGPGMVPLDLATLGASFYAGNCHKWLCAPKGAAFLHVREDLVEALRPLVVSHGATRSVPGRSRFRLEHDWTGTLDPSAWLAVPAALEHLGGLLPGGWRAVEAANRTLALAARDLLCAALDVAPPCPDDMVGSLAAVPLPPAAEPADPATELDPLQDSLYRQHAIEVPVVSWPGWPHRLLRVSAMLYNDREQVQRLAGALVAPGLGTGCTTGI